MPRTAIEIRTQDGLCPASEFRPSSGSGPWPAVLFMMDGLAIRPALFDMGQRLADAGYFVLLPDLFYRAGPYAPLDPRQVFSDEQLRKEFFGKYFASTSNAKLGEDARFFLDHLAAQKDVESGKVGTHGYCMGGGMALTAAALYPDRVVAAASFHGGNLASDKPDSPHLRVKDIKAKLYIGVAVEDSSFPAEQEEKLKAALDAAKLSYRMETYPGALHGWTMKDFPIYKEDAAERHWRELLKLYGETLR
jgi:carboxymethylenebutenolidase